MGKEKMQKNARWDMKKRRRKTRDQETRRHLILTRQHNVGKVPCHCVAWDLHETTSFSGDGSHDYTFAAIFSED